jgi:peptide/nickel transport system substrate-binding protein
LKRSSLALVGLVVSLALVAAPASGAPEQTPKRGGTVVFGPVREFTCLNPVILECGPFPQVQWIHSEVLLPAFAMAPDYRRLPVLVSGARVTARQPFTLVYDIRPEARWSDGVPVTSRDFEFTQRALEKLPPDGFYSGDHGEVKSFHRLGAKHFRVTLPVPVAGWRDLFRVVLPRHALAGRDLSQVWQGDLNDPRTGKPIGNGPFLVQRFERGRQLTLTRNPNYWGPHPAYLDRLVVRFCRGVCNAPPAAEALERIRAGEIHFAYLRDTSVVPQLRRIRGITVRAHRANMWDHLTLRVEPPGHPALGKKLVRQALAYGIDRRQLMRELWGALEPRYEPLQSVVLMNTARGYVPNWARYSHQPERARSLLRAAGCRPGTDGIFVCDGERLRLRLYTLPGTLQRRQAVELIGAQLRRIGVEMVISYTNFESLETGDFEAFQFAWTLESGFDQKQRFGCSGAGNPMGYCQRIVTADLDQADRIVDPVRRARVLNRVDRQLAKDVPVIPLYQIPWVLAYHGTIRNVVSSPDNLFWNAENWWLDD